MHIHKKQLVKVCTKNNIVSNRCKSLSFKRIQVIFCFSVRKQFSSCSDAVSEYRIWTRHLYFVLSLSPVHQGCRLSLTFALRVSVSVKGSVSPADCQPARCQLLSAPGMWWAVFISEKQTCLITSCGTVWAGVGGKQRAILPAILFLCV